MSLPTWSVQEEEQLLDLGVPMPHVRRIMRALQLAGAST